nr:spore coat protein [Fredinandcohnia onubensis]
MNQETFKFNTHDKEKDRRWSALDPTSSHPCFKDDDDILQEATQKFSNLQLSEELIFIKDSCDVTVNTTDNKAAISLQAALQAAIVVLINISIADNTKAEQVTQELLQSAKINQITRQKTVIENSRNVDVKTTDNQIAINIQLLLQILLALLVQIDIL